MVVFFKRNEYAHMLLDYWELDYSVLYFTGDHVTEISGQQRVMTDHRPVSFALLQWVYDANQCENSLNIDFIVSKKTSKAFMGAVNHFVACPVMNVKADK